MCSLAAFLWGEGWGEGLSPRIRLVENPLTRIASSMRPDLSPQAGRGKKKAGIAPGLWFAFPGCCAARKRRAADPGSILAKGGSRLCEAAQARGIAFGTRHCHFTSARFGGV